jgi:predicted nucleic acid-binding protein
VANWAGKVAAHDLYISVVTVEELEIGVLRLERRDSLQGAVLRDWMNNSVLPNFAGRILAVDSAVAQRSARLRVPDPCPIRDGFIAATALEYGMTVVTRNVADFARTGVTLLNPWQG